jgi:hypothetical protein
MKKYHFFLQLQEKLETRLMLNHLMESNHNNTATILRNQEEVQAKIAVVEQQQVI